MGTKQSGKRQYLYLSVACLTVIFSTGCLATIQQQTSEPPDTEECFHLELVKDFIDRGDFEGAMKASQRVLSHSPKSPPGDEALLNMGLINAHYANPKKDYKKALGYFLRVEREFPRSPLVEEAKIWIGVLRSFEKAKQVDIEIEEKKKEMGK